VTLPQLALSLALGILFAWAVVRICRWRQRALQSAVHGAGPEAETGASERRDRRLPKSSASIYSLRKELRARAIASRSDPSIDLFDLADSTLKTAIGRALYAAQRDLLAKRYPLVSLAGERRIASGTEQEDSYDCPICQLTGVYGSLRLLMQGEQFLCTNCYACGDSFRYVLLAAPCYENVRKAADPSLETALLFFTSASVHREAADLRNGGEAGQPSLRKPSGPWRPRSSGPASLEVAACLAQDRPWHSPSAGGLQPCSS